MTPDAKSGSVPKKRFTVLSNPGSDLIMTNLETNETIEVSLKASSNPHYIEESLMKYPEIPILTTSEQN